MNWIDLLLAQGPAPASPATQPAPGWFLFLQQFGPIILIVLVFYFFIFGSKRKQEKQRQNMLSQLKKGDEVVTIGGQVGKVIEARPDRVQLKVDESSNTKIWFLRSAIHRVLDEEKTESK